MLRLLHGAAFDGKLQIARAVKSRLPLMLNPTATTRLQTVQSATASCVGLKVVREKRDMRRNVRRRSRNAEVILPFNGQFLCAG